MNKFWASEANKFTLYGAIFGFLFPVIATLLQAFLKHGSLGLSSLIDVQMTDPLLWIIDSAPFWLGLFPRFAGRRQDNLKEIIRQNSMTELSLPEEPEDAQQFAGLLTFFGIALIGVVLFGFSIWLQRLIISNNTLPAAQQVAADLDNDSTAGVGASGVSAAIQPAPTATIAPVVINIQPATIAATFTPEPTMPPAPTAPPTPLPVAAEPAAAQAPAVEPVAAEAPAAEPAAAEAPAAEPAAQSSQPATDSSAATSTVAAAPNQIILGLTDRDPDCQFFTELAAASWQSMAAVSVEIRPYADISQLFAELTADPNSNTMFLTFCFVDPDDRSYLREHLSKLQIIGKAYWANDTQKLLTVSNSGAPGLLRQNWPNIYNYVVNQNYEDVDVAAQDAATWLEQNQAAVQQWMGE